MRLLCKRIYDMFNLVWYIFFCKIVYSLVVWDVYNFVLLRLVLLLKMFCLIILLLICDYKIISFLLGVFWNLGKFIKCGLSFDMFFVFIIFMYVWILFWRIDDYVSIFMIKEFVVMKVNLFLKVFFIFFYLLVFNL